LFQYVIDQECPRFSDLAFRRYIHIQ
jgi:hypothetical protein